MSSRLAFVLLLGVQVVVILVGMWAMPGDVPGTLRGDWGTMLTAGSGLLSLFVLAPALHWLFVRVKADRLDAETAASDLPGGVSRG